MDGPRNSFIYNNGGTNSLNRVMLYSTQAHQSENRQHVTRMTATNGYVHDGGQWDWDDLIVGNFHSKLGPISWAFSNPPAWNQNDFNQWNLEAMQAGGMMTWSGATTRVRPHQLYTEAISFLRAADDFLALHESPGTPNWARAHTPLPNAAVNQAYFHNLVENIDFWDPEGHEITSISAIDGPSWLSIRETTPGVWQLSGTPDQCQAAKDNQFELRVEDASGGSNRSIELTIDNVDAVDADDCAVDSSLYMIPLGNGKSVVVPL